MKTTGHLTVCDLILTTRSPLHIGSGNTCAKTDYLFDPRTETVSMIDPEALLNWLYTKRLADRYEKFIFSGDTRMDLFLRGCGITDQELDRLCLYRVNAADALDANHSLKELHTFIRDSRHQVYVPGSSVKGALRTAILANLMIREKKGVWPDALKKNERGRQMQALEGKYLNTVALKRDKNGNIANDPVNSILRGLSVSDSEPVSDTDIILVGKIDANKKGEYWKLPLCRECIRPGTELRFKLTLDHTVLPDAYSPEALMQMVQGFDTFYQSTYLSRFSVPSGAAPVSYQNALVFGGGSGFFSKSLAYPYRGTLEGMQYTQQMMEENFRRHHHAHDIEKHGISPRTMKYGLYQGKLYPYGVCGVQIV